MFSIDCLIPVAHKTIETINDCYPHKPPRPKEPAGFQSLKTGLIVEHQNQGSMQLVDISPAVSRIASTPILSDLRASTYLLTYPHISALVSSGAGVTRSTFLQLAAMIYGWMPRILRVDSDHMSRAVEALHQATIATPHTFHSVAVKDIAVCLHSVVGASKMLHFVNNAVFPIWDSKIESFRLGHDLSANHMGNVTNYLSFVSEVHVIRSDPNFPIFYADFQRVYGVRLQAMGIEKYPVSEVRAVEAAAFELA